MTKIKILTSTENGLREIEVECLDGIAANPPSLSPFEVNTGALIGELTEYLSDERALGKVPRYVHEPGDKIYKGGTTG